MQEDKFNQLEKSPNTIFVLTKEQFNQIVQYFTISMEYTSLALLSAIVTTFICGQVSFGQFVTCIVVPIILSVVFTRGVMHFFKDIFETLNEAQDALRLVIPLVIVVALSALWLGAIFTHPAFAIFTFIGDHNYFCLLIILHIITTFFAVYSAEFQHYPHEFFKLFSSRLE